MSCKRTNPRIRSGRSHTPSVVSTAAKRSGETSRFAPETQSPSPDRPRTCHSDEGRISAPQRVSPKPRIHHSPTEPKTYASTPEFFSHTPFHQELPRISDVLPRFV